MTVSLQEFLMTGRLGDLHVGLPVTGVLGLLGEPDRKGGTSRRYQHPNIYGYRDLEVYFSRSAPYACSGLHLESEAGEFQLPEWVAVGDWDLRPRAPREEVLRLLQSARIPFRDPGAMPHLIQVSSGVVITFDDDDRLDSLGIGA